MSKIYKSVIGEVLFIWAASVISYFIVYDGDPMMATMVIVVASVPMMLVSMILTIRIIIVSDKEGRLEKNKELQMRHFIQTAIDGVVDIQKQPGRHTYKAYTDTDVYMVEHEETSGKIIHMGEYQRIDIEG